jgi:hypothetical protein
MEHKHIGATLEVFKSKKKKFLNGKLIDINSLLSPRKRPLLPYVANGDKVGLRCFISQEIRVM